MCKRTHTRGTTCYMTLQWVQAPKTLLYYASCQVRAILYSRESEHLRNALLGDSSQYINLADNSKTFKLLSRLVVLTKNSLSSKCTTAIIIGRRRQSRNVRRKISNFAFHVLSFFLSLFFRWSGHFSRVRHSCHQRARTEYWVVQQFRNGDHSFDLTSVLERTG